MSESNINLPGGANVPYLTEWFGYWAMHVETMHALYGKLAVMDVTAHLRSVQQNRQAAGDPQPPAADDAPPAARAETMTQYVRRGYSYEVVDGVAIVSAVGTLMKHESSADESTSTVMLRNTCRKMTIDPTVRGVILKISSPGGTVAGAYDLADDIAALSTAKPTYSYIEDLGASAAYLIASQTRGISSNRNALIGSIGTYGVVWDMSKMFADAGVKVYVMAGRVKGKAAPYKGAGTPGTEITDEQRAAWQEQIDAMNDQFIDAVATGRKMDREKVEVLADGNAHIADKARKLGLIDRVESLDQLFARVRKEAGVSGAPTRLDAAAHITINDDRGRRVRQIDSRPAESTEQTAGGRSADESTKAEDAGANAAAGSEAVSTSQEADMGETQQQSGAKAPTEAKPDPGAAAPQTPAANAPATAPTAGSVGATEPRPATIAELRAEFPGDANASFVLSAAENAWTIGEAKSAHAVIVSQVEARSSVKQADVGGKKPGVAAIPSAASEQSQQANEGGTTGFIARRDELVKTGMSRAAAVMKIAAEQPDLHQAFLKGSAK